MTTAGYSAPFTTTGHHYAKHPQTKSKTGGLNTTICAQCEVLDCRNCKATREALELVRSSGDSTPLPRRPVCNHSCVKVCARCRHPQRNHTTGSVCRAAYCACVSYEEATDG